MDQIYDVAIIGGGPAGSTAATILAKEYQRSVIVIERERFPFFKIGESLLPHSMRTFDRLGVQTKLQQAGFIEKFGANIVSACGEKEVKFYFSEGFRSRQDRAYQVTRSEFDKVLLDHSREAGAEVREGTAIESIDFLPSHVELSTKSDGATSEKIRASYVIDCSGRNSLIGTKFKLRQPYKSLKKFSIFAHYDDVDRDPGIDGTLTRMVRASDRWFWHIPLTEKRTSIGVVMDIEVFKKLKLPPEQAFEAALKEQPVLMERMKNASRVTPIRTTGDYSYRNSSLTGDRWLLAGDAAGFIDPVFSSGVFLAILSGETAADAIGRSLVKPAENRLFANYARRLNRVMDIYLRFVNSWYTQEFMELFLNPTERLQLASAVNSVLAGNTGNSFGVSWRLKIFYVCVFLQNISRWSRAFRCSLGLSLACGLMVGACAPTSSILPYPAATWKTHTGQVAYKSKTRSFIGDVILQTSPNGDITLDLLKGPGPAMISIQQKTGHARVRGAAVGMGWQGDPAAASTQLTGWLLIQPSIAALQTGQPLPKGVTGSLEKSANGSWQTLKIAIPKRQESFHFIFQS